MYKISKFEVLGIYDLKMILNWIVIYKIPKFSLLAGGIVCLTLCVRSSRIRDRRNLMRVYEGHESVTPGASREYGCHEFVTSSFPFCYYSYRARSALKLSVAYIVYILQSLFYKISLIK